MKIRYLVVHSVCFILLIYFLAPVSIEYFNYKTITTTYTSHFLQPFPKPKLFIVESPELEPQKEYGWESREEYESELDNETKSEWEEILKSSALPTIHESININQYHLNVSLSSTNVNNVSTYEAIIPKFSLPNMDYKIWFIISSKLDLSSRYNKNEISRLARRYQLLIKYDISNDTYLFGFDPFLQSDISAQIFGSLNPPHGNCTFVGNICSRVRFARNTYIVNGKRPSLRYMNSITMIHVPDIKFSFSTFVILVMGIIGLFSDVTAINLVDATLSMIGRFFDTIKKKLKIAQNNFLPTLLYQTIIYFTLGTLCSLHAIYITGIHLQYNIQSTMNEGPSLAIQSDLIVKICAKHIFENSSLDEISVNERISVLYESFEEFKVQNCTNSIEYSVSDDGQVCVEQTGSEKCLSLDQNELVSVMWKMSALIGWIEQSSNIKVKYLLDNEKMDNHMSINPTDRGLFHSAPTFRFRGANLKIVFKILYLKAEFLQFPYTTKCVQNLNPNISIIQLKCIEERYILQGQDSDVHYRLRLIVVMNQSMDIKVSPSMTMFDYISCLSTLLGFWLGLSIMGIAEFSIGLCCKKKTILLIGKLTIWVALSAFLSYFIVLRFQEYFQYDVSSELSFMDNPKNFLLPPLVLETDCENAKLEGEDYWTGSEYYVKGPYYPLKNAKEHCKWYNLCQLLTNVSLVGVDGEKSCYLNSRCYAIEIKHQIAKIRFGEIWNPKIHKFILIPMEYTNTSCVVSGIKHSSDSVETIWPQYGSHNPQPLPSHSSPHEFLGDHSVQFDYTYSKILESPYQTNCGEQKDPLEHDNSWYHCLINRSMHNGLLNRKILQSCDTGVKTYSMGWLKGKVPDVDQIKDQCITEANLRRPCQSWSSQVSYPPKRKDSFPGHIVIEPKSTVTYVLTPKIRSVDFFILLFDQIGFWLGFNFVFICLISIQYLENLLVFILGKSNHDQNSKESTVNEDLFTGRRMNALKHWKKYSKIRKRINAIADISVINHGNDKSQLRRCLSVGSLRTTKTNIRRLVKTAPNIRTMPSLS